MGAGVLVGLVLIAVAIIAATVGLAVYGVYRGMARVARLHWKS